MLAVFEARDKASEIVNKVSGYLDKFSGTVKKAGETAQAGGTEINEGLLKTASGADALDVAAARVEGATAKLSAATDEQAAAERNLLEVRSTGTASTEELATATDQLAAADKRANTAAAELTKAQAIQGDTAKAAAAKTEEANAVTDTSADKTSKSSGAFGKLAKASAAAGLGIVLAGGFMAKGAADFQSSTTVLQTSGGQVASQMGQVRAGILNLSSSTGTALQPLVDGMYMIGSAGYTGGSGLRVLQSAAQGAKAENADLGTVSNALTTILKDYNVQVTDNTKGQLASNAVMNQMIAVVQNGKTTTEQLAGSLSSVLPIAASVHLGFDQIGGAMATMTGQGMSAQQSAQDLNNVIGNLAGGNQVASKEMQALGLNANDVRKALGNPSQGLTGALTMVNDAIAKNFKDGAQVVNTFQASASAAQNANTMISKMPASMQALAKSYMDGSVNSKQWKTDLQALDPVSAHLMQQFAGVADQTHEFNNQLLHGTPAQQSASQALSKMLGGTTGLNVALMLGANKGQTFTDNVKKVGDAAKGAGANVNGWAEIQGNFNQKLAQAKQTVEVTGISIGTALLPMVTALITKVAGILQPIASWVQGHQHLTVMILGTAAGIGLLVGGINLGVKAFKASKAAIEAVSTVTKTVLGWLGLYSGSADAAAASSDAAAASADGLAVSEDAAAVSTEGATVAADASRLGWLGTGASALVAAGRFLVMKAAQLAVTIATKSWTVAQWAFNAAMDANPITLVVIALAALAGAVIYAYTHFSAFKAIVDGVFNWIKGAVVDTIGFVKDNWQTILGIITFPIGGAALLVYHYWDQIKGFFADGVHGVEFVLSWFGSLGTKFAGWLASGALAVGRGVGNVVGWFLGLPGRVASAIASYFGHLAYQFEGWVGDAEAAVERKGADILKWFKDLPGKVTTALGNLDQTLWDAGASLIKGFINGIGSMFGDVETTLGNLTSDLTSWKGPPSTDKVLLVQSGVLVMQGFTAGLDREIPQVRAKLQGLTATIRTDMAPAASAASSFALAPAGVSASGGSGPQIVIDLRGSQVLNDQAATQLANKIGNVLATQILPAAGVRIRS